MDDKELNKLFKDVYDCSETDIEIFKIWVETRHITKFVKSHPNWRNVTRNGMRGQRSIPCSDDIGRLSLMDHIGLWKDEYGRKVFNFSNTGRNDKRVCLPNCFILFCPDMLIPPIVVLRNTIYTAIDNMIFSYANQASLSGSPDFLSHLSAFGGEFSGQP